MDPSPWTFQSDPGCVKSYHGYKQVYVQGTTLGSKTEFPNNANMYRFKYWTSDALILSLLYIWMEESGGKEREGQGFK